MKTALKSTTLSSIASVCLLATASTGVAQDPAPQWRIDVGSNLSDTLDCFEVEEKSLISAHRGGPSAGLPENAIETMDAVLTAIPAIMEFDVAASSDGVHYLMHDRTLDRTTTGTGNADELEWSAISQLRLVDAVGWVTPYSVPTLEAALNWAKDRTVVQIDFKRSASYERVIDLVRQTGTEQRVILIAYSVAAAAKMHELAPEMLISLSLQRPGALDEAVAAGIPADRLVAFTGTRLARPDLYSNLDSQDVEVIFGTLGGRQSLDKVFARMGTDERYAELSEQGVDIIATDRPRAAAVALKGAGRLPEAGQCGVSR